MARTDGNGDDRILRRLRYAAAAVALGSFGLLMLAYVAAYLTDDRASAPDAPLVIVLLTAVVTFLGLNVTAFGNLLGGKRDDPER